MVVSSSVRRRLFAIGLSALVLVLALAILPAAAQPLPPVELVKDIVPGSTGSSISEIVDANGLAFLSNSSRIYRSDGTADGTFELCFCLPRHLASLNGLVLFQGYEPSVGYTLFRSDGTPSGSRLVGGSVPTPAPMALTRVGDYVYFLSQTPGQGSHLWRTDGTAPGTVLVRTFTPSEGAPVNLIAVGDRLFLETAATNGVVTLWTIPAPGAPPQALRSFVDAWMYVTANSRELLQTWAAVGGTLFFTQYTAAQGVELWKSDGTAGGTVMVADLVPGRSSNPMMLTDFGGRLAFFAEIESDTSYGRVWISDGTAATTHVVSQATQVIGAPGLSMAGGRLIFSGGNGTTGGLYSSDGTEAGTTLISPMLSSFDAQVTLGNFTYFRAYGILDMELWRTDGTAAGTVLLRDILPGMFGSGPRILTPVGGALFFVADDGIVGGEPWRVGMPIRSGTPSTIDDAYTMSANTVLTVPAPGLLANDSANGGGTMTAQIVSNVSAGSVSLSLDGSFAYTPPAGFTGTATFTYRAVNAAGPGFASTVTIVVTTPSVPPTTTNDSFLTSFNTPLSIAAPGLLANDNSNGGGAMSAQLVTGVTAGTLNLNANGSFSYTPPAGFAGATSFSYRAVNSVGSGNTATVTLTVNAGVPTSVPDPSYSTQMDTPLTAPAPGVLGNDSSNGGGALAAQLLTTTTNGTLALASNGGFSYTPNPGFQGSDSFAYRAVNSVGPGNAATVTILVRQVTDPQPPTNLYAASIVGNTVTLRFTPPATGPAPAGYVLEGGLVAGTPIATIPTGSADPIYTLVAPTGSFFVRMRTLAVGLQSLPSNEIPIHVNVPVPPSAPAHLTGLANGSAVALAWRNTFAGGAPGNVILDVAGSLNASLPLGLTDGFQFVGVPGGTYTFSVRAQSAGGISPSSNAMTLSFPGDGCLAGGTPQPPSNFLAYRLGSTIHVLWDPAASGPAPTGFVLNVGGAFGGSFGTPGRSLSGNVGPGTYHLSVAAANACGVSGATAVQTIVIP